MQDPHDSRTVDAFPETLKRGRGRPKTGTARTNAERQRAYRQRKAAGLVVGLPSVTALLNVTESVTENEEIEMWRARVVALEHQLRHALEEEQKTRHFEELAVQESERLRVRVRQLELQVDDLQAALSRRRKKVV
jgi:hypothetical protein